MTQQAEQFRADYEKALNAWYVYSGDSTTECVWVEAEARTGSKYVVQISKVPGIPSDNGNGTHLVSVVQPWQTCWPITGLEQLHESYVLERFRNPARGMADVHGGDLAAITQTINYAILKYSEWCEDEIRKQATR
jgi:hypothetical protein